MVSLKSVPKRPPSETIARTYNDSNKTLTDGIDKTDKTGVRVGVDLELTRE